MLHAVNVEPPLPDLPAFIPVWFPDCVGWKAMHKGKKYGDFIHLDGPPTEPEKTQLLGILGVMARKAFEELTAK